MQQIGYTPKLDRTPGVAVEPLREIVEQLAFSKVVDLIVKGRTDATDGATTGFDDFRAQSLQLEMSGFA